MPDPQAGDRHRRPREPHRYRCNTCQSTMSTSNPVPELEALWKAHHDGHDTVVEHDDDDA